MPTFNGKLSQSASELLISYLTAPYPSLYFLFSPPSCTPSPSLLSPFPSLPPIFFCFFFVLVFVLTVTTYLRIPLVLNFFACSEHIHALSQVKLQNVLDAIMFEPGAWHPPKDKKIPACILVLVSELMLFILFFCWSIYFILFFDRMYRFHRQTDPSWQLPWVCCSTS